ncbi:hypothetical protein [Gloeothece verrucosa]|uniref:Uncharacterized protein n=1 Tax=Gloeothece verrucosa (strain PCC 7822) TaxID=497965 RepID=E0UNE2_GLOV7|nr:hypothetical protein [Gloeothece verrucosa]ADN18472.1 hypothetical protein Cyan7822_6819 [Gloeothece verrucosa PCC 7822]
MCNDILHQYANREIDPLRGIGKSTFHNLVGDKGLSPYSIPLLLPSNVPLLINSSNPLSVHKVNTGGLNVQ